MVLHEVSCLPASRPPRYASHFTSQPRGPGRWRGRHCSTPQRDYLPQQRTQRPTTTASNTTSVDPGLEPLDAGWNRKGIARGGSHFGTGLPTQCISIGFVLGFTGIQGLAADRLSLLPKWI